MDKAPALIGAWAPEDPWRYAFLAFSLSLLVRVISCVLKTFEVAVSRPNSLSSWSEFWRNFRGFGSSEPENDDYLQPFIIGTFELTAFPVLIATNHWALIGAWLGFKTLAQHQRWGSHRAAFNRFLIGTALILLASY